MKLFPTLLLVGIFLMAGCASSYEECVFIPDTSLISLDIEFEQLEETIPAIETKQELVDLLSANPVIRDIFFNRSAYPNDSIFINSLYQKFTHPAFDTLLMETEKVFGDLTELKASFQEAFKNIKYYYPEFEPPKIKTLITGLESDVFVSDSLILIGLDYFLGPEARFQPDMYEYMRRRYTKDFVVPSVLLLYGIDYRFNKTEIENTVLSEMIAFGKAYYFAKHMVPCMPDSILIGYTAKEITGAREYEELIWSRFVEDEVLFSTSQSVKQKYIAERPKTLEVGEDCPGRIGTWVGWQMVNTYSIAHPEESLPDIMSKSGAEALFRESGYKPQIVRLSNPGEI